MLPWERGPLRNVPGPAAWCLLPPGAAQPSLTIPSSFPTSATGGPLTDQTPHLKVMELSGFRVLTGLHNHHHNLILEHFHHPRMKPHVHKQSFHIPPTPTTALSKPYLISNSTDLLVLDISHMENYSTCGAIILTCDWLL